MNQPNASIMNLPNEIIYNIWNKLDKIDVLYSFMDVNKRFNKLVRNMIYTRSIELTKPNSYNDNCSLNYSILDRFCLHILPQIHELVEFLTLESMLIERILSAGHYPHLRKLIIIKVEPEFVIRYFIDNSPFAHIFKQQITHLKLSINDPERTQSMIELSTTVFARIFVMFASLSKLYFGSTDTRRYHARLKIAELSPVICFSSSIVHLRISVDTFDDCLCLLDGRLTHLCRLVLRVYDICTSKLMSNDTTSTSMRSFSLTSYGETKEYDSQVIPLLRRMIYLDDLMLRLCIRDRSAFIDSTHLNNEILIYLPRLQTLTFNIITFILNINGTNWTNFNEIQHTFYNGKSHQFLFYIDQYPRGKAQSHIYSIPYTLNDLRGISHNFPGGLFTQVHTISLMDIYYAFEHDFFIQIAHSFPLLTDLCVLNNNPQKFKQSRQLYKNDQISSIVEFSNLTNLTITFGCIDYVEQFLVDTNTRLSRLDKLTIEYEHLESVTGNFTRDATRLNCSNIERLTFNKPMVHSKDFYMYFSCCK